MPHTGEYRIFFFLLCFHLNFSSNFEANWFFYFELNSTAACIMQSSCHLSILFFFFFCYRHVASSIFPLMKKDHFNTQHAQRTYTNQKKKKEQKTKKWKRYDESEMQTIFIVPKTVHCIQHTQCNDCNYAKRLPGTTDAKIIWSSVNNWH